MATLSSVVVRLANFVIVALGLHMDMYYAMILSLVDTNSALA